MIRGIPVFAQRNEAEKLLKATNGFCIELLTNTLTDRCWYSDEELETWYDQREASQGDIFYDAKNGDKHKVISVDHTQSRLVAVNLDQDRDILSLVIW